MDITPAAKKKIQTVLLLAIAVAALRSGYILYERHSEKAKPTEKIAAPPLNPDYYVTAKKLYPYDLKSAKQLTQQPVWVKEGYRYSYYRYERTRRRTDFSHDVGQLLPIEKLQIEDVVTDVSPSAPDQRQVMAIFEKEGKSYAFPIGSVRNGNYQIYSDEMLYLQDPHELYKHWPREVWQAIDSHQAKSGMNEIQMDFAIGMGVPERSDDPAVKTVHYRNGGNALTVTYRNGKAEEIKPASVS